MIFTPDTFYIYDQMGRLTNVYTDTLSSGNTKIQEGAYTYYAGTTKRLQLANSQAVDYRYTPRDWVRQINQQNLNTSQDPANEGPGGAGVPYMDVFGEVLGYNIPAHFGDSIYQNAAPHWNGNISWMMYNMSGVAFSGSSLVGNTYSNDRAGRLTGSNFGYYSSGWQATGVRDSASGLMKTSFKFLTAKHIDDTSSYYFTFDHNWEMVPDVRIIKIWQEDTRLAQKEFICGD